jgi:hypothetical protein
VTYAYEFVFVKKTGESCSILGGEVTVSWWTDIEEARNISADIGWLRKYEKINEKKETRGRKRNYKGIVDDKMVTI